jgi:hypothetical protein
VIASAETCNSVKKCVRVRDSDSGIWVNRRKAVSLDSKLQGLELKSVNCYDNCIRDSLKIYGSSWYIFE